MNSSASFLKVLRYAPSLLFGITLAGFGCMAPKFFTPENLLNIAVQVAPTGIVATGMTLVLIAGGVDLSVGAAMFVGAAMAGKLALGGMPLGLACLAMVGVGLLFGALNGWFVTRMRIPAFIVTLSLLFIGRGFALWLTQTRAINVPDSFLQLGAMKLLGVPLPLALFAFVALAAHTLLTWTSFGRKVYAVGHSVESARKVGISPERILKVVYVVSGCCAALGGILVLARLGTVSPKFGDGYEFKAIAAAVLGGTSLLGGRGAVLPGTVLGALLIQCVENGLVLMNADPYLYPLITSGVIFTAVLLDSARTAVLARAVRRKIRTEPGALD